MKVLLAWNDMRVIKRSFIFGIKYCFKGYIKNFDNLSILAVIITPVHSFSVPENKVMTSPICMHLLKKSLNLWVQ